jgi:hypothetical protein
MTDDAVQRVLRLVGEGHLTPEEAGPILDALASRPPRPATPPAPEAPPSPDDRPARALRIEIREAGRTVVNLRVPLSLGRAAINRVPGISELTSERIREAIVAGIKGPILQVDEQGTDRGSGDGVRISIE